MVWQRIWHSGAARRDSAASTAFGRSKWWGMAGILVVGGATAYLLPGFAGDRGATEVRRQPAIDAQTDGIYVPSGEWQNVPHLASESSPDATPGGDARALALQAAVERERERADAAQRELSDLQAQLAGLEENEALMAEYRSAAIEEKERTNNALLRTAASHEELARLRAGIIEAQKAAENEKSKATLAHKQLEVVQGQLAALISGERHRAEKQSQVQPKQDQVAAVPAIEEPASVLPVPPRRSLPLVTDTPPSNKRRPEREAQPDKSEKATSGKARPVAQPTRAGAPARSTSDAETAPVRDRGQRSKPEAARVTKLEKDIRGQSADPGDKASTERGQRSRMIVQDFYDLRSPRGPSLPRALLPDSRLW
jgi:hypothetical protein